jgi:hypothetical protein
LEKIDRVLYQDITKENLPTSLKDHQELLAEQEDMKANLYKILLNTKRNFDSKLTEIDKRFLDGD